VTTKAIKLAPSILAADFARLGEQVVEAERAGADRIHVDVMDGHFVPNLSMGAAVVKSLRRVTRLPLEAHLMISNPDFFVDEFAQAGTDSFLVHWEGNNDLSRTVQRVKALGKRVGVAINPAGVAAQMESGIVFGLSAAMLGAIEFKGGRVQQSNFHDYRMLRINEMPVVEVHILDSGHPAGGLGEPGVPSVAPAVCNAIYALTGKRIRRLPIDTTLLKRA